MAALTGCDDDNKSYKDPSLTAYSSIDECANFHEQAECEQAFRSAAITHQASAPKYEDKQKCDDAHQTCTYVPLPAKPGETHSSSGFWMPYMIGYMMGQNQNTAAPMYYGPASNGERIVISRGATVGTVTPNPTNFSFNTKAFKSSSPTVSSPKTSSSPSAVYAAPKSVTAPSNGGSAAAGSVSRGGFGSTGHAMSSGGTG